MKKRSSGQKANFSLTEVKQAVQAYEDSRKQRADKICDAANERTAVPLSFCLLTVPNHVLGKLYTLLYQHVTILF